MGNGISMVLRSTVLVHGPKPKGRRQWPLRLSCSTSTVLRKTIINAWMVITTTTMLAIAFGSIATMLPTASAQHPTNSLHSQGQSNYQGVDAVSAITGLSNGYATPTNLQSYYQFRERNAAAEQEQPHHYMQHHTQQHRLQSPNTELYDKDSTNAGRSLQPASGQYGSWVGGSGGGAAASTANALEVHSIPENDFIPTSLTAAGQHYAKSFATPTTDKHNAFATSPTTGKVDLQQSTEVATSYSNMLTSFDDKSSMGAAHRLHGGRLANYEDNIAGAAGGRHSNAAGDKDGVHNFALAYDNYAANVYNEAQTNGQEHQQHFANYFTPTSSALAASSAYGAATNQHHKYLPLNNFHYPNNEQRQQQTHLHSRSYSVPVPQVATTATSSHFMPHYDSFNQASNDLPTNYQTWNLVDQPPPTGNYYFAKDIQPVQQSQHVGDKNKVSEPEAAETAFVAYVSGKKSKSKNKRSDPLHDRYESKSSSNDDADHSPHLHAYAHHDHGHTYNGELQPSVDNVDTVEFHQHKLDELQKQLEQQQHQFINMQHQLIDHDQQLQIQKHQAHYQTVARPTLPPVTTTVHHSPHSLQAIAGSPLSKHTHVVRPIPIAQRQPIYVPKQQNVYVEVPDPIITTEKKPTPIQIPVSKTVAIPDIKEVKIPIEKVKPYPVERAIPYIVEKRVPYTVEKQVAKPFYYSVPIKVPIVHTVIHNVRTVHPQHYQTHNHIPSAPVHYKGHGRHVDHHHGYGNSLGHYV